MESQKLSQLPNQSSKIGAWIENQTEYQLVVAKEDTTTIAEAFSKNLNKIVDLVTRWNLMLGGKTLEKHEYTIIMEFIKNNYSTYKLKELELIINLSVTENVTQTLGYFQRLNCNAVSVCFNFYKKYQEELILEINKKKLRYEQQNQKPKEVTNQDRLNILKESLVGLFKRIDANQEIWDFGDVMFNWLLKRKAINKEMFDSFGEKASAEWERYKATQGHSKYGFKQMRDVTFMGNERKTFIIDYCKKQSIRFYLTNKIVDRNKFISELTEKDLL